MKLSSLMQDRFDSKSTNEPASETISMYTY
jgi:hypothetical protein